MDEASGLSKIVIYMLLEPIQAYSKYTFPVQAMWIERINWFYEVTI